MALGIKLSITHIVNSTPLAITVASATPIIPSFGAPKRPKIKTALSIIFKISATAFVTVEKLTHSILLIAHRYT